MKKTYIGIFVAILCILGVLPVIAIVRHHIHTAYQWHHINRSILDIKRQQDKQEQIHTRNQKWLQLAPFSIDNLNQQCRTMLFLQHEKRQLHRISEASLLFYDPRVLNRKKTLAMMPKLSWKTLSPNSSPQHITLSHTMEMETEDLAAFLKLFNTQTPFGFFSYLEFQKQPSLFDHQVWKVQAEALCY